MISLVSMPFVSIKRPSLALGILKACLQNEGLEVRVEYPILDFADQIGLTDYAHINSYPSTSLLGEWVFSGVLFPDYHPDHENFLASLDFRRCGFRDMAHLEETCWRLRGGAEDFVDKWARRLTANGSKIVGCSSTFSQNVASLALLKRIREIAPEVITIMGGANCEAIMGVSMAHNFPWVDFVVSGEADELIGPFCRSLLERGREATAQDLPYGVISPLAPLPPESPPPRAVVKDMRTIPTPDFDEYFTALESCHNITEYIAPGLSVETSRGCWWGAKHHCTFCGLNGHGMGFRSRTPEQALEQFHALAERYQVQHFMVADNILDMSYFKTVVPSLAETEHNYEIFYETKANLRRDHLELLHRAGIRWIQPGLETLQDDLLHLMDKGTTTLQNVQLLKWCRELGIHVTWLLLFAFPDDKLEWYEEIAELIPQLYHLQPPNGLIQVGYHRFSPYFENCERYGIDPVPEPAYNVVYPFDEKQLSNLAYYFQDRQGTPRRDEVVQMLVRPFRIWNHRFWSISSILSIEFDEESATVVDSRSGSLIVHEFFGKERQILMECEQIRSRRQLIKALDVEEKELLDRCHSLQEKGLLLRRGDQFLGLAVKGELPTLPRWIPDGRVRAEPEPQKVPTGAGIQ